MSALTYACYALATVAMALLLSFQGYYKGRQDFYEGRVERLRQRQKRRLLYKRLSGRCGECYGSGNVLVDCPQEPCDTRVRCPLCKGAGKSKPRKKK